MTTSVFENLTLFKVIKYSLKIIIIIIPSGLGNAETGLWLILQATRKSIFFRPIAVAELASHYNKDVVIYLT